MTTNALDSLLGRIQDASLRSAIETQVARLRENKDFGLVFEKHLPENVRLLSHPVRRGVTVQERKTESLATWTVQSVRSGKATIVDESGKEEIRAVDELVVVRGFGEPIYPGLRSVDKVERGGEKPFHVVINSENFYALETLLYAYEDQVSAIYLDPPYNSGARDWKYNNDYVDGDDAYRHSKWLSFMEKRLKLAKRLLDPEDSVLIVTIDEKEYLRLGLLLEDVFHGHEIQMVSSVINPKGSPRRGQFSRADEYIFFVYVGSAQVIQTNDDMLHNAGRGRQEVRWAGLRRNGANGRRTARPNLFFPIFFRKKDCTLHSIGEPLPLATDRSSVKVPRGTIAVFPLGDNGQEMTWGLQAATLRENHAHGYVRFGEEFTNRSQQVSAYYLPSGPIRDIEEGRIQVLGKEPNGALIVEYEEARSLRPMTVWNRASHSAGDHGASLLNRIIPGHRFPFPKSLYAVEDTLRFFTKNNSHALVLDFFGGSGTTTHAVARLNRQDGGMRRSILVTNNEVSDEEAGALRNAGHFPGQSEWEALGIFEHVTVPRVKAAFTGKTPSGSDIEGDYKFSDEFPMAEGFKENVEFFELTYLDRNTVAQGKAFEAIAPLLWMKFGAVGAKITKVKKPFAAPADALYAILFDINHWQKFTETVRARNDLRHVCIVTDSVAQYQQIVAELPPTLGASMLYEDYLRNFEINAGDPE